MLKHYQLACEDNKYYLRQLEESTEKLERQIYVHPFNTFIVISEEYCQRMNIDSRDYPNALSTIIWDTYKSVDIISDSELLHIDNSYQR